MSRIFDALENAKKIGDLGGELEMPLRPPPVLSSFAENAALEIDMEQEMISLYQTITSSLPDIFRHTILLIGSRSNEGTSTIARQLAKTVSLKMEKAVLLVDLDRSRPDLHIYPNLTVEKTIDEIIKSGDTIEKAFGQSRDDKHFVMPLFRSTLISPSALESAKSVGFWEPLKERFDLVIVDAPPAVRFPDGLAIVSQVDGVILVVEAEKTRWQVALRVKEKILSHGGNVIGVAFNKRRYYIPQFIYNHL
jgi:protein-tyrosine kinase